jgi:hypothetical protein
MRINKALVMLAAWPLAGCVGGTAYPAADIAAGVVAMGAMVAAGDRASAGPKGSAEDCSARGEDPGVCDINRVREAEKLVGWMTREEKNKKFAADFDEHFGKTPQASIPDSQ